MPAPTQPPTVLLVEDSDDDVFFFRHALKKAGSECVLHHVGDGGAARAYLQATLTNPADPKHPRPDVVFLDLKIPTFNGFEVLTWIRQQDFSPPLNVVVLSGSEHASDKERAAALGASDYFVKPISSEQLRTQLGRCTDPTPRPVAEPQGSRASA